MSPFALYLDIDKGQKLKQKHFYENNMSTSAYTITNRKAHSYLHISYDEH